MPKYYIYKSKRTAAIFTRIGGKVILFRPLTGDCTYLDPNTEYYYSHNKDRLTPITLLKKG